MTSLVLNNRAQSSSVACYFQHSPVDAMVLVTSTYYCDLSILKCKGKWQVIVIREFCDSNDSVD